MKIDCYISEGCTSEEALINESEAIEKGIMGSPAVFINGVDILPGEMPCIS
jgi:hypothetical protein